jgi:hypothetical protein
MADLGLQRKAPIGRGGDWIPIAMNPEDPATHFPDAYFHADWAIDAGSDGHAVAGPIRKRLQQSFSWRVK